MTHLEGLLLAWTGLLLALGWFTFGLGWFTLGLGWFTFGLGWFTFGPGLVYSMIANLLIPTSAGALGALLIHNSSSPMG